VVEAQGITSDEAALSLFCLGDRVSRPHTRGVAVDTLRRLAKSYGLAAVFAGTSEITANEARGSGPRHMSCGGAAVTVRSPCEATPYEVRVGVSLSRCARALAPMWCSSAGSQVRDRCVRA
jgi:hypothetical protein